MRECRLGHGLPKLTQNEAQQFLADQAVRVQQPTLDQYRQAIESHLGISIENVKSEVETVKTGRAYTEAQKDAIKKHQKEHKGTSKNRISAQAPS